METWKKGLIAALVILGGLGILWGARELARTWSLLVAIRVDLDYFLPTGREPGTRTVLDDHLEGIAEEWSRVGERLPLPEDNLERVTREDWIGNPSVALPSKAEAQEHLSRTGVLRARLAGFSEAMKAVDFSSQQYAILQARFPAHDLLGLGEVSVRDLVSMAAVGRMEECLLHFLVLERFALVLAYGVEGREDALSRLAVLRLRARVDRVMAALVRRGLFPARVLEILADYYRSYADHHTRVTQVAAYEFGNTNKRAGKYLQEMGFLEWLVVLDFGDLEEQLRREVFPVFDRMAKGEYPAELLRYRAPRGPDAVRRLHPVLALPYLHLSRLARRFLELQCRREGMAALLGAMAKAGVAPERFTDLPGPGEHWGAWHSNAGDGPPSLYNDGLDGEDDGGDPEEDVVVWP